MSVAVDEVIDDSGILADGLERRRSQFRRRRIAMGVREWISLAATGAIGLWVCAIVVMSVSAR